MGQIGAGVRSARGCAGDAAAAALLSLLQWTPKDDLAALKLHGRCDDVMRLVMAELGLDIPRYDR